MTLPWKIPRALSSITHLKSSRLVHWGTWWSITRRVSACCLPPSMKAPETLASVPCPLNSTVPFWRLILAPEVRVKSLNTAFLAKGYMGVAEVNGIGGFELDLDAVKPCAFANPDFGDGIAEIGAFAEMGFDERGRGALLDFNHIAGGNGAGIGIR